MGSLDGTQGADHRRLVGDRRGHGAGARRARAPPSRSARAARTGSTSSPSGSRATAARRSRSRPTSPTRPQARSFVEDAASELGGLDILVNNAGVMLLGPVAGRRHGAMAADDQRQPASGSSTAPTRRCRSWATAGSGRHRQRLLGGGPQRHPRQRRLQHDQVGRRRLLRGAAPGGALHVGRPRHLRRARLRRHRAPGPQRAPDGRRAHREDARATGESSRPRTSPTRSSTRSPSRRTWASTRSWSGRPSRAARPAA